MYFDSLQAVLFMDGHGAFVWAAYAITTVVLVLILVLPRARARGALRRVAGELRRAEADQATRGQS
jgi:heme exporter protein D